MRFKALFLAAISLSLVTSPLPCIAGNSDWVAAGFGAGVSTFDSHQYLEQYEVNGVYRVPWNWRGPGKWTFHTGMNATAGVLTSGGDTGLIVSVGPKISLARTGLRFSPFAGGSLVFLSRDKYGRIEFGGPFQFLVYLGLNFRLTRDLFAEYQFQHMSNAHVYSTNPGMEMHLIQMGYCF